MGVNYDLDWYFGSDLVLINIWYFGSEIERGDETKKGDEHAEKEAEKERGDEIKKFDKTILQTQNLDRMVNSEGTKWGLGREKSDTIREIGCVPITGKVNVFVLFLPFPFRFQIWELNII